jgi:stage II sporulation protein P
MNRKWFQLWNIGRLRGKLLDILSLGRTMLLLAGGSLVFFMLLGAGGLAGQKLNSSPIPSMKGLAASLSSGFFMELLGMEVPHLPKGEEPSAFSGKNVTSFVFRMLTSVDPGDPKSLLSREVPGWPDDPFLLRWALAGPKMLTDYHPGTDDWQRVNGTETGRMERNPPFEDGSDEPGINGPPQPEPPAPDSEGGNGSEVTPGNSRILRSNGS